MKSSLCAIFLLFVLLSPAHSMEAKIAEALSQTEQGKEIIDGLERWVYKRAPLPPLYLNLALSTISALSGEQVSFVLLDFSDVGARVILDTKPRDNFFFVNIIID